MEKTSGPSDKEVDSEEASESAVVVAVTESPLNKTRKVKLHDVKVTKQVVSETVKTNPAANYFSRLFSENALYLYDTYSVLTVLSVMLFWVIIFYDMVGDQFGVIPGYLASLSALVLIIAVFISKQLQNYCGSKVDKSARSRISNLRPGSNLSENQTPPFLDSNYNL